MSNDYEPDWCGNCGDYYANCNGECAFDEPEQREFGCLFPDNCCMPGFHYVEECHTPEMVEEYISEEILENE